MGARGPHYLLTGMKVPVPYLVFFDTTAVGNWGGTTEMVKALQGWKLGSPLSLCWEGQGVRLQFLRYLARVEQLLSKSFLISFFKILFLERGEGKEKQRKRNSNVWLPLVHPHTGTWPASQACALTGNPTGNPLVHRQTLNPVSHLSQGLNVFYLKLSLSWSFGYRESAFVGGCSVLFYFCPLGFLSCQLGVNSSKSRTCEAKRTQRTDHYDVPWVLKSLVIFFQPVIAF